MVSGHEIDTNVPSTYLLDTEELWHMERSSSENNFQTDNIPEQLWQLASPVSSVTDSFRFDVSSQFLNTDMLCFSSMDSLRLAPLLSCPNQLLWANGDSQSNLLDTDTYYN